MEGIVAAGHPVSAEAGAAVLREGGNAVDAAVAACLASWVGRAAADRAGRRRVHDGRRRRRGSRRCWTSSWPRPVGRARGRAASRSTCRFGDAVQVFHVGAASVGAPGTPRGLEEAARRWGSLPLADLAAPAARAGARGRRAERRAGLPLRDPRGDPALDAEARAPSSRPRGARCARARPSARPSWPTTIERFGAEGAAPFTPATSPRRSSTASRAARRHAHRGRPRRLRADRARAGRASPTAAATVLTNPPPSAGGTLLALAWRTSTRAGPADGRRAGRGDGARAGRADAGVRRRAGRARLPERFLAAQLGSTTHVSSSTPTGAPARSRAPTARAAGWSCPGTGIHLNNIMGEEDLNPLGFFTAPPGRRMPSMMAPTVVLGATASVELVLGSAGSNRIRSAILQLDRRRRRPRPRRAPRRSRRRACTWKATSSTPSRASTCRPWTLAAPHAPFRARNLFFGGAQAVERDRATGALSGAGDPRRGGAAARA